MATYSVVSVVFIPESMSIAEGMAGDLGKTNTKLSQDRIHGQGG
jgi:hypothetical protein